MRFVLLFVLSAVFGIAPLCAAAQELAPGSPTDGGMAPQVLDAATVLYSEAVARGDLAGVVLLVARHGKIVLHTAIGWSDVEGRVPMTTGSRFDIASMTKPLVATATLILAERGVLALDDPVSRYIPAFAKGESSAIRIRHLLSHTSGFRMPLRFVDSSGNPTNAVAEDSLQAEVAKYPLLGPAVTPGTTFSYSNPGFNTLAAVIEVASGRPLPALLSDLLYRPLGMTNTSQLTSRDRPPGLVSQYGMKDHRLELLAPTLYPFAIGAGFTASTASDYAKFLQMYLAGGTHGGLRILELSDLKMATSVQVRSHYIYPDPEQLEKRGLQPRWYYRRDGRGLGIDVGYGLGWVISQSGTFCHPGVTGTFAWVDPARDMLGVILTQSNDARNPGIEFINVVNAAVQ